LAELRQRVAELKESEAARKRAERESEERRLYLESVLACVPDAIVTLDAQHNILEWNPGAERLFGYTLEEVVGRKLDDLITGPDTDVFEEATSLTRRILTRGSVSLTEMVRYRKDGSPVDVIASGSPILIGDEVVGVVAVYTDITERKRAEEKLRLFSHSADSSIDGMAMGNIERRITYVNETFCRMFGYSREELIGKEIAFIHSEDQMSKLEEALKATFEGGWIGELVGKRKDGELFPMMVSASRVLDDEGKVIAVMASHRDITERKRVEEEIKRRAAQLATLHDSSAAVASRLTLKEILDTVVQSLSETFDYRLISIYLIEEGVLELKAYIGYGASLDPGITHVPLEKGVVGRTVRTSQPQLVTNVEEDPDFFYGAPGITSEICVPLKRGDEVLGVLSVESDRVAQPLDGSDLQLLTLLSNHIVIALENARLYETAQRELAERKRAEEELKEYSERLEEMVEERTAELQAYYARQDTILRSVGDAILMTDPEQGIVYVNPAFTTLTGYTADDLLGKQSSLLGISWGNSQAC
jgi:PAS domain S-box-containing protein